MLTEYVYSPAKAEKVITYWRIHKRKINDPEDGQRKKYTKVTTR